MTGILFFMDPANTANIDLEGNAASSFNGAVFAPNGSIDIGGTSGINPTYNTQLMGGYVKVHGNADININFNGFQPHTTAPQLDVQK